MSCVLMSVELIDGCFSCSVCKQIIMNFFYAARRIRGTGENVHFWFYMLTIMFVWTHCFRPWRCRWRGDDNVSCTCRHFGCFATGLGWGGMITFLAIANMLDATELVWGGGGWSRTCTHVGCYAIGLAGGWYCSLYLHRCWKLRNWSGVRGMINCLHLHTCWMIRNWFGVRGGDNIPSTCTHVGCYGVGLGWGGMITLLAFAHMLAATQLVLGGGMITFLAFAAVSFAVTTHTQTHTQFPSVSKLRSARDRENYCS